MTMTEKRPQMDPERILGLLKPQGYLSNNLKGFETREQQSKMMANIIHAYNHSEIALIEAGTGTGKTLAYLLPALAWAVKNNQRSLISTNTITLQEQLLEKDIPALCKALNIQVKAVLVKGMNNYLCLRKLGDAQQEAKLLPPGEAEEVDKITAWKQNTREGSRSDLKFMPSPGVWERVNAESDTCNGTQCPHYAECFFIKARREASDAQILVANHNLLFADLNLRAETDNYDKTAVLPPYDHIILDEAHNVEDIATEHFGSHVSRLDFLRILSKLASDGRGKASGKLPFLKERISSHYYKGDPPREVSSILLRLNTDLPAERQELFRHINSTFEAFTSFMQQLKSSAVTSDKQSDAASEEKKLRLLPKHAASPFWQDEVVTCTQKLLFQANRYMQAIRSIIKDIGTIPNEKMQPELEGTLHDVLAFVNRLEMCCMTLEAFVGSEDYTARVRWIESQKLTFGTNIRLMDAALDIAPPLVNSLFSKFSTIVLCSATLTTNQKFDFVRKRFGLMPEILKQKVVTEHIYDSPFNYPQQAMLVVPTDIPNPTDPLFTKAAAEKIWLTLLASRGNAFILFTSYSMLRTCYEILAERLAERRFNVLKQGDHNRLVLLNKFKEKDNSVLFGTDSFWEGVDIAGDALRCVIIVKLPFKVPSEPIIEARTESIAAQGGDPFIEYSVPHAIVKFKQGFGRLIRNKSDRGCIVCLDNRLITKNYGKLFLNSLPACQQLFTDTADLHSHLSDFYRKTYHLVANKGK